MKMILLSGSCSCLPRASATLQLLLLFVALFLPGSEAAGSGDDGNAEEARWLVQSTTWSTFSWLGTDDGSVNSMTVSHAQQDGRIVVNIPTFGREITGALTFSEAQVVHLSSEGGGATCGPDGAWDPEDPRCAKLTISGVFKPHQKVTKHKEITDILFGSHPELKDLPTDKGFTILELVEVKDIWMIANYGGGGTIDAKTYFAAQPNHHPANFRSLVHKAGKKIGELIHRHHVNGIDETSAVMRRRASLVFELARPTFTSPAAHARWLVSNSLWTTISTDGSKRMGVENQAWGNIRSMHDGECLSSSLGLPVFYLPGPDPTAKDVQVSNVVSLSFTEASLPGLVDKDGKCNGKDPEDPICFKVSLHGHARLLTASELGYAMKAFKTTHPRATWLAQGGAHTGGSYYTIDLTSVKYVKDVNGPADIAMADYLNWKPSVDDKLPKEQLSCEARAVIPVPAGSNSNGGIVPGSGDGNGGGEKSATDNGDGGGNGGGGGGNREPGSGDGHGDGHGADNGSGGGHGDGTRGGHGGGGKGDGSGGGTWKHGPHAHNGGGDGPGNHSGDSYWGGGNHGKYDRSKGGDQRQANKSTDASAAAKDTDAKKATETIIVKEEGDGSPWSFTSFFVGTSFGFMVWGPAIAFYVHNKYSNNSNYGGGRNSGNSEQSYSSLPDSLLVPHPRPPQIEVV